MRQIEKADQEGTGEVNRNSVLSASVEAGGTQVVVHARLDALVAFADRIAPVAALSAAVPSARSGVVLTHAVLSLAAGGKASLDIELLSSLPRLFGAVASDSTLYRTIRKFTPTGLANLERAHGESGGGWGATTVQRWPCSISMRH